MNRERIHEGQRNGVGIYFFAKKRGDWRGIDGMEELRALVRPFEKITPKL